MSTRIGVRELRNDVSEVLRRVETGEDFVVSVRGRPVAHLSGLETRPRTMPTAVFVASIQKVGADPALLDDLKDAFPDTSDDITPW